MSRRQILKTRFINPDPFYDSILIQKIINQIMKKGKKILAYQLLNQVIEEIEKITQQDPIQIIEQAIQNAAPAVEIKARRIGGAVYSIPIELSSERSISIAIKWILNTCNSKSGRPFVDKLTSELIDASKKVGSVIRRRDEVHRIAESNTRLI
nr:ribosomal protein S7 [Ostreobium quekettii]